MLVPQDVYYQRKPVPGVPSCWEGPAAARRGLQHDAAVGGHHWPREGQQAIVVLLGLLRRARGVSTSAEF